MIKKDKDIVAVSIGEDSICAAYLKGSGSSRQVAGLAREEVEGADVGMWSERMTAIAKRFGLKKTNVISVVPSNIITTKNIEIPSLDEEEIRSIIDLQAGRHTPYSREEILIGYVAIGIFQRNYTKVLLVIANREAVKSRIEACEMAGFRVEGVLFSPECIALFYAQLLEVPVDAAPVGMINLGYSASDFIVGHNRTIVTCRSIPVGIKEIRAQGQEAKDRFLDEIVQSLEIYNSEDINTPPSKYIITDDSPLSRELQPLLQDKLQAEVAIVSFEGKVSVNRANPDIQRCLQEDSFASLIAAAQMTQGDFQVDLMPDEIRNQRQIEEKGKQVILSGIFSMILLLLVCGIFFVKIYFQSVCLEKLKREYAIKQFLVVQLDKISHRTRIIKDFLSTRMISLDVVENLYQLIPEEMYLQNIFMDEQGVVNIQGISASMSTVFDVVKALEDSDLFKSVKTRSTTAKKDRGKDAAAFDIVFKLESAPDGPIGEEEPADDAEKPKK